VLICVEKKKDIVMYMYVYINDVQCTKNGIIFICICTYILMIYNVQKHVRE